MARRGAAPRVCSLHQSSVNFSLAESEREGERRERERERVGCQRQPDARAVLSRSRGTRVGNGGRDRNGLLLLGGLNVGGWDRGGLTSPIAQLR